MTTTGLGPPGAGLPDEAGARDPGSATPAPAPAPATPHLVAHLADLAASAAESWGRSVTSGADHLVAALAALASSPAAPAAGEAEGCAPAPGGEEDPPAGPAGERVAGAAEAPRRDFVVLADRGGATVVRVGGVVAKAHPPGTDGGALGVRLGVAGHPAVAGILLPPYRGGFGRGSGAVGGRPVTVWPYGVPVDPRRPEAAPWEAAATLLARLHAVVPDELPGPLPPMRGPAKAAAALARLRNVPDCAAARTVRAAWSRLPGWARDEGPYDGPHDGRPVLCHGDWHLGQLVHHPEPHRGAPSGGWLLIDVDDLGLGDPAWDLARPAMWFGAGLLAPEVWARFLGAYRAAGGRAVPAEGDPWERLDVPARALAVQSAAIAVAKAARDGRELDEAESELVAACARIAQLQ